MFHLKKITKYFISKHIYIYIFSIGRAYKRLRHSIVFPALDSLYQTSILSFRIADINCVSSGTGWVNEFSFLFPLLAPSEYFSWIGNSICSEQMSSYNICRVISRVNLSTNPHLIEIKTNSLFLNTSRSASMLKINQTSLDNSFSGHLLFESHYSRI